ncbi:hypothetical protein KFE25_000993 [Diacronema lutheri]|uniref:RING-type domain-containing protein n=1 Tax=Diacronema lutheri TaxID=2081491 RepID=A0A8J6C2C3_DIALT|nr:hypothetical protein KFE25_000993 [Diacronema lutheri]
MLLVTSMAASPPLLALSIVAQIGLQFAGFHPLLVFAANCAVHYASMHLFLFCRRWLLDGRSRRRALEALCTLRAAVDGAALYGGLALAAYIGGWRLGWLCHVAMLAGSYALVLLVGPLRAPRRAAAVAPCALPAVFTAAGALVGWLATTDGVASAESGAAAPLGDSAAARFAEQLLTDAWFCLSICWPLILATAAIVLIPTGIAERLFTHDLGAPPYATEQQLRSLKPFALEERHFLAHALLVTPCAICLERFQLGESALQLGCRHIFHADCVLPWVRRAATCPTCRARL